MNNDTLVLPHGLEIDMVEAWSKLSTRQFGGDPGRAFAELIQNCIDGYPSRVPMEERRAEIRTGTDWISIRDFGEGMDRHRLRLLVTLGGTDKENDPTKIGRFGIGFFSIFNPALGTRRVLVQTSCEGSVVEVAFLVHESGRRPELRARVLGPVQEPGTEVRVEFDRRDSPARCVTAAARALRHFPCAATLDGNPVETVWSTACRSGRKEFREGDCHGLLDRSGSFQLLCKYEPITTVDLNLLATGGHGVKFDLRDLEGQDLPWLPYAGGVINSNALSVTISRDAFYLDGSWRALLRVLGRALEAEVLEKLDRPGALAAEERARLVLANQYTLRSRLRAALEARHTGKPPVPARPLLERLLDEPVYRLRNRRGLVSLADIERTRTPDLPVFISSHGREASWLGGRFRHDFVVLPMESPEFYEPDFCMNIFRAVFGSDVIDLDSLAGDTATVAKLVERGIVSAEALKPKVRAVGRHELDDRELALAEELDDLLSHPAVLAVVRRNLRVPVSRMRVLFFQTEDEEISVASGLLNADGAPVVPGKAATSASARVYLGVRRGHPLIEQMLRARQPRRAHFALTLLVHHLAAAQRQLVPTLAQSRFIAPAISSELRRALLDILVPATAVV